jgi:transketolase
VVFVGDGAGVVYSSLGTSHQSTEDIAALRAVPNLTILSPADVYELESAFEQCLSLESPVYLRFGKADLGHAHSAPVNLEPGKLLEVQSGDGPLTFIATGSMLVTALRAAEHWPGSSVWSAPWIKPLDENMVGEVCEQSRLVVVLEEHSVYGGLGSAVAEIAATGALSRVLRIGIEDRFSQYCGSYDYLMREHGLTTNDVVRKVTNYLAKTGLDELLPQPELTPRRKAA